MGNTALKMAVSNVITVNIYCLVIFKVLANTMRDAAAIAVNSEIQWVPRCNTYKATWSENDCMMIDVNAVDGSETDEFNYASVKDVEGNTPSVSDKGKLYEVDMYFNLEIEVDDADDDEGCQHRLLLVAREQLVRAGLFLGGERTDGLGDGRLAAAEVEVERGEAHEEECDGAEPEDDRVGLEGRLVEH